MSDLWRDLRWLEDSTSESGKSRTNSSSESYQDSPESPESPHDDKSSEKDVSNLTSRLDPGGSESSSSTSSPSEFPPIPKRPRYPSEEALSTQPKSRKKRGGKVIDELRKKAKSHTTAEKRMIVSLALGTFNLAHSSTSFKIASMEMADSLGWHLVNLSGTLTGNNFPSIKRIPEFGTHPDADEPFDPTENPIGKWKQHAPLRDLGVAYKKLSKNMLTKGQADDRMDEVIFAVLTALGSRRSTHSAIVGVDGCASIRSKGSADEYAALKLGQRREQACRKLVDIAVEKIEASGYLEEDSLDGREVLVLSKLLIFGSVPEHPFGARIVDILKEQVVTPLKVKSPNFSSLYLKDQILMFDVLHSINRGSPLRVTEEELLLYGWRTDETARFRDIEMLEATESPSSTHMVDVFDVNHLLLAKKVNGGDLAETLVGHQMTKKLLQAAAFTYRDLLTIQRSDGVDALPNLEKLLNTLDTLMRNAVVNCSDEEFLPHIFVLPQVVLSLLMTEIRRRCRGKNGQVAQNLLNKVQCRYLFWMHELVQLLKAIPGGHVLEHTRALMLVRLDFAPGWVEVCVNGATQADLGIGPLANAGFTLDDFRELHTFFKESGAIFGSAAKRESDIASAFEAMGFDQGDVSADEKHAEDEGELDAAQQAVKDLLAV